jgi:zinc transport system substrate-binding protein
MMEVATKPLTTSILFTLLLIATATICIMFAFSILHMHFVLGTNSNLITNINNSMTNAYSSTVGVNGANHNKISVVASFFPIYEFTKAVGGNRIDLSSLIPFGSEPHDFDPTIQEIQKADSANLLVYNGASMEEPWIHKLTPQNTVDTSKGITLLVNPNDPDIKGPNDPHIWLNPILAIHQVQNIRDGLDKVDPKNAAYYNQNAQTFIGQLNKLDAAFKGNLSSTNCAKRDFISFHQAFGYFAPQYAEDLVDPRSAQAIAEQIPGSKIIVLSPIEGIKAEEQKVGIGYLDKMYQDLAALKEGLQCKT